MKYLNVSVVIAINQYLPFQVLKWSFIALLSVCRYNRRLEYHVQTSSYLSINHCKEWLFGCVHALTSMDRNSVPLTSRRQRKYEQLNMAQSSSSQSRELFPLFILSIVSNSFKKLSRIPDSAP